ncbi:MAG TPA: ATPase [Prolixibacteraceae bacterium]|nr:ATPase [Prolixibacteraceae bacterium]
MEKRIIIVMNNGIRRPKIVVLTGAESTGKSVLSDALARHYNAPWFPEFARDFVLKLDHHYYMDDVISIARMQRAQMQAALNLKADIVFFDTWLIITQIWLKVLYNAEPTWIPKIIRSAPIDLILLCDTDIPWEPDPIRENGGERRNQLSEIYKRTIENYGFPCQLVQGKGDIRTKNAIDLTNHFLQLKT